MVAFALDLAVTPKGELDPERRELLLRAHAWGLLAAYAEEEPVWTEEMLAHLGLPQAPLLPLEAAALTGYLVLTSRPQAALLVLTLGGRALLVGRRTRLPHLTRAEDLLHLARPYEAAP